MIKHLPRSESVSGQRFQFVDASMVSQLTKLLCCLTSDLLACILLAASLMSFNCLLCGHPPGGIRRLQRTQAPWCLDLLPIPREVGRCLRIFWYGIASVAHRTIA